MRRCISVSRKVVSLLLLVSFCASSASPALAVSPVKLHNWSGIFEPVTDSLSRFHIAGTASHLGRFTAHGEVGFLPVGDDGALMGGGTGGIYGREW
jgi:hypothetical protein